MNPMDKRIRRLLRAERLSLGGGEELALRRCRSASEVLALAIGLWRSLGPRAALPPEQRPTWLARMDTWRRGQPDPWLDEAVRLGLPVREWLGEHESILMLVGKTLERCLTQDLRDKIASGHRQEAALAPMAAALCEAADPVDLRAAQQRLLEHPNPEQLTHFSRVWPPDDDLCELRRVYMVLLSSMDPSIAAARSVVGCVDVLRHGSAEQRRALYDWNAVAGSQSSDPYGQGARSLPLQCGIRIPLDLSSTEPPRFSAFELIDREKPQPPLTRSGEAGDLTGEAFDPETLDRDVPSTLFPAVDRVLLVLGRAVLGVRCPREGAFLPALSHPASDALPLPAGGLASIAPKLGEAVAPYAAYGGAPLQVLQALLNLSWDLAERARAPELISGYVQLQKLSASDAEEHWVSAWTKAIFGLCLWRWREGLLRILALLPDCATLPQSRELPELARAWLRCPPPPAPPPGRRRRPDGVSEAASGNMDIKAPYNAFDLDLLQRIQDGELIHLCASWSIHQEELLTWGLNDWQLARSFVETLASRAGLGAEEGQNLRIHGSSVWIHHRLLDRLERSLDAFKRTVSKEGLAPWSLAEIDEAVLASRPPGLSARAWRSAAAERAALLPGRPWGAAKSWVNGLRSLGWLEGWARGVDLREDRHP